MSSNVRYTFPRKREQQRKRLRAIYATCPACGCVLDWQHPYQPNSAEVDEIYPISKLPKELRGRAAIDPDNLQVLCRRCNKLKGNKTPQQLKALKTPDASHEIKTSREW